MRGWVPRSNRETKSETCSRPALPPACSRADRAPVRAPARSPPCGPGIVRLKVYPSCGDGTPAAESPGGPPGMAPSRAALGQSSQPTRGLQTATNPNTNPHAISAETASMLCGYDFHSGASQGQTRHGAAGRQRGSGRGGRPQRHDRVQPAGLPIRSLAKTLVRGAPQGPTAGCIPSSKPSARCMCLITAPRLASKVEGGDALPSGLSPLSPDQARSSGQPVHLARKQPPVAAARQDAAPTPRRSGWPADAVRPSPPSPAHRSARPGGNVRTDGSRCGSTPPARTGLPVPPWRAAPPAGAG